MANPTEYILPRYPCEALAFIQLGITGLIAQGLTDNQAESKAEADKIGKAWLALGNAHNVQCECPDPPNLARAMTRQLNSYLRRLA